MTTLVNYSFFLLFLVIAMLSLFVIVMKSYMDDGARIILTSIGFVAWLGIGFWLLDGTILLAWGLSSSDLAYTFMQWLPFFLSMIPVAVSINRWGKVRQQTPFGEGGSFESFESKPIRRPSGYDQYKALLRGRTRRK